jgi:hypothetical protein
VLSWIADYNEDFEMKYLSWTTSWVLTSNKWFLKSDVCASSDSGWNYINYELCTKLRNRSLDKKPIKDDSILYSFLWWITWVYLDSINNDDYLKYDVSRLDLNSWSWFAIEMSVRGSALKRTGWIYFLSTTETIGNFLLWLNNWDLYFWKTPTNSIIIEKNILQSLVDDDFYTINATHNINWIELQIKNRDWVNLISSPKKSSTIIPIFNDNIFIWSNNSSQYQWNDIIDYVKIYRK